MAAFTPRSRTRLTGLAALLLLASAGAAAAPTLVPGAAILLDAQSTEIDYRNNGLIFHKVKISQGPMSIAADSARATGLDFENSHWVFHGAVRITMEQGQLTAEDADVVFANKLLVKALIQGKPAAFEQRENKLGKTVQGRADEIDYEVAKNLVRLLGNAWLSDGLNEIRGESVKYNILERKVLAEGPDQNSQRVHIKITPPPAQPAAAPPNGSKP